MKKNDNEEVVYTTNNNVEIMENMERCEELLENIIEEADINVGDQNAKHFEIVDQIADINKSLKVLDEYLGSISDRQSQNDLFISDLLHFVEIYDFTPKKALNFVNLLKQKRLERRKLNYEWEIKKVYDTNRQKIGYENQRDMFMTNIYKKEKELSFPYNYRVITPEEIEKEIR